MELTWHGHATWHVSVGETTLLIDPFFDNPKTGLAPSDLDAPDAVLLTHGHADHVGDVGAVPGVDLVAGNPELMAWIEAEHGLDTLGFNLGGTVEIGDAYVTMHRSDHTAGIMTTHGQDGGVPAGFVVGDTRPTQVADADSTTFYHAGDTALMVEAREVIAPYLEPDAAAVPIGDHFTMGPTQAAIAVDWLDVDHAFPMHYDTFPPIEQDPEDFAREVDAAGSDAEVHVLAGDESVEL